MFPILLHIGPITIRTYGALVAIAFLASLHFGRLTARRYKIGEAFFLDLVALLIISGLLGARILYIFVNLSYFRDHPWESFKVWEGGLVFYGGFLLAALVGVIFTRYRGYSVAEIADICAPGLSLGQAIGRWGCFFAGCCYGKPTPLPWGIRFKDPASLAPLGVQLHPVQIYESVGNLLIAGLLWLMMQRRHGQPGHPSRFSKEDDRAPTNAGSPGEIFWLYVLLYGILRFAMETFRGDDRGPVHGGLAPSQIIALIAILISGSILLVQKTTQHDAHA